MKAAVFLATSLIAAPALADPGHFSSAHGHSHWLAAGALALATVIGGVALWRSRGTRAAKKAERKA
jgi:hypothetical protein